MTKIEERLAALEGAVANLQKAINIIAGGMIATLDCLDNAGIVSVDVVTEDQGDDDLPN